jgi:uncharacterized membrane protein
VLVFLRFIGIVNAAVWFGSVFFFTFAGSPVFLSEAMLEILPRPHAEASAHILARRFYFFQYGCAAIALLHLLGEFLYAGRPFKQTTLYLLLGMLGLALIGGQLLQPRLQSLHREIYGPRSTAVQQEKSRRTYTFLHGARQFLNTLVSVGLLVYIWQIAMPGATPRFVAANKFRG